MVETIYAVAKGKQLLFMQQSTQNVSKLRCACINNTFQLILLQSKNPHTQWIRKWDKDSKKWKGKNCGTTNSSVWIQRKREKKTRTQKKTSSSSSLSFQNWNVQNHLALDVSLPLRSCFEFRTTNTCDDYNALMFASFWVYFRIIHVIHSVRLFCHHFCRS